MLQSGCEIGDADGDHHDSTLSYRTYSKSLPTHSQVLAPYFVVPPKVDLAILGLCRRISLLNLAVCGKTHTANLDHRCNMTSAILIDLSIRIRLVFIQQWIELTHAE